jgi:CBS domain-containing protein
MLTVRDVMTRSVSTVRPETPLRDVAQLLAQQGISGVPVVGPDGAVVGVVSEADLLVKEQGVGAIRHRPLTALFGESRRSRAMLAKAAAVTAAEAMTAPPITVTPRQSLHEAAAIMTERRVNRLPVLDGGELVGIVSRADLVRAYVRSDEELAATIRDDVIRRILWLDPALFTVSVRDGVAAVVGHVERRTTAEMVEHAIAMVPGVMGADIQVSWAMDDRALEPASLDPVFPFGPQ